MNNDAIDDIRDDVVVENDDFKASCRRECRGKKREKGHVSQITLVSAHVTFCQGTLPSSFFV